jgi:hypothetical protein
MYFVDTLPRNYCGAKVHNCRWEADDCTRAQLGNRSPVVRDGSFDGSVEGAQMSCSAVGLTDLGGPPSRLALPDSPVSVVDVLRATLSSRRSRQRSLDPWSLGLVLLRPARTARKQGNVYLKSGCKRR